MYSIKVTNEGTAPSKQGITPSSTLIKEAFSFNASKTALSLTLDLLTRLISSSATTSSISSIRWATWVIKVVGLRSNTMLLKFLQRSKTPMPNPRMYKIKNTSFWLVTLSRTSTRFTYSSTKTHSSFKVGVVINIMSWMWKTILVAMLLVGRPLLHLEALGTTRAASLTIHFRISSSTLAQSELISI